MQCRPTARIPNGSLLPTPLAGYSIEYPAGTAVWQSEEKNVYRDLLITSPANITMLKITFLPGNQTIDDIRIKIESNLKKIPDYSLSDTKKRTVSDMPAVRYNYTWTAESGEPSRSFLILATDKPGAYIVRHDNSQEHYMTDNALIEKIVHSIKRIPDSPVSNQSRAAGISGGSQGWGNPPVISNSWSELIAGSGQEHDGYENYFYYQDPYSGIISVTNPQNGESMMMDPASGLIYKPSTGTYYYYNAEAGQIVSFWGTRGPGTISIPG